MIAHLPSVFMLMAPCRRLQFNLSDLYPVPRLGIGYLASYLRAHEAARVELRDIIAEREWVPELCARFAARGAPDLLGISITILSLREAFEIARGVKARFPKIKVVVGGPGVGFRPEGLLRYGDAVDFFVRGEGEDAMLALVRALPSDDFTKVPRLIWRDRDGRARENPAGPYRNLDDGVRVAYDDLPMAKYRLHPPMGVYPPATMMETVRGCTYPCDFCCLSMPVRARSPADVEAEVRALMQRYGLREVHFIDPTFTLNRPRAIELSERMGTLGIRWSCKTRVDRLDEPLAGIMARGGCYLVAFGVESGDDQVLTQLHKKAVADNALETFRGCRKHKIRTTAYLMIANPGDTDETTNRTISYVRKLEPDYVLYDILMPDPLNPLTQRAIAAGKLTVDDLERYYMSDEPSALHDTCISGHDMGLAREWITRAATDFYVRPRYFFERIRDLRTLQDARNLGSGGFHFFRDKLGLGRLWGIGQ